MEIHGLISPKKPTTKTHHFDWWDRLEGIEDSAGILLQGFSFEAVVPGAAGSPVPRKHGSVHQSSWLLKKRVNVMVNIC